MKSIDQIEHLLTQTPAPCVVEGPHREQLKRRLLEQWQLPQPRRKRMNLSVLSRMPSMMKLAAALLAAAILIGTGWASEKIYRKLTTESTVFSHTTSSGTTDFETNAPNPTEREKQVGEEIKQAVALKKYKFVRTIDRPWGDRQYLYWFHLADGTRLKAKYPPPRLEEVASWDEYERKSKEYAAQRQKDIEKAIASGKGRLIDFMVTEIHVCRDVESGQKLDVRRAAPSPGEGNEDFAYLYPGGMQEYEKPGDSVFGSSSWRDHLRAIREGKRELLDIRLVKQGIYETVRADGSKLVFARELPLQEKP